jgi:hypothetical protein
MDNMAVGIDPDSIILRDRGLGKNHDKPLSQEELDGIFQAPKRGGRNIVPFISTRDLNNQNPQDIKDCNRPKSSLVIGIKGTF